MAEVFIKSFPPIICAKCNKQVGSTAIYYYQESDRYQIVVSCHGELDSSSIPASAFRDGWKAISGKAFGDKIIDTEGTVVKKADIGLLTYQQNELFNDPLPDLPETGPSWNDMNPPICTKVVVPENKFDIPSNKFDKEVGEWAHLHKESI